MIHQHIGNPRRKRMAGVTLLELMAVVMVIGILSMFALPSYRQYVMRAQRTEAKAALLQLATNQERFYLANNTYSTTPTTVGFPNSKSEKGTYALTITGADANGFTATATPTTGGAVDMTLDAMCTSFSITSQGVKSATGSANTTCW